MSDKQKTFVSAVIYVRNAENRIEDFLRTVIIVMEENFEHSEIICVNDASEDNSFMKIKEASAMANTASVTGVNMSFFHGVEMAMNAGGDIAIGDFVFEFDNTNLDYDSEMIMKVYYHALEGFDIVSASSNKRDKFMSHLFYKVFKKFTNLSYDMNTESFRILSRRVINRINSMNKIVPYRKVTYASTGLKTDSIKYTYKKSEKTRLDKKEKSYRTGLAVDSLILFTEIGFKFSVIMTVLMMLMSVFMIGYSVFIYTTAHPVEGWTTTILFLSVAFLGLFVVLTVIIKYLQIILNLIFKRKHYNFESVEKFTV